MMSAFVTGWRHPVHTWILDREEYREWKSPSYAVDRPEALWIYGKAGIGETFLSARIIEDLKQTSSLPAVFFFATHEDCRKMEPLSILRSWILQLASMRVCAFEELKAIRKKKINRKAAESDLWSLFSSCLQKIGRCFLLVDGYDELSNEITPRRARLEGAREIFLKEVFQCVVGTKAHLIFISRNEDDIRQPILEACQNSAIVLRTCCICPEDTAKDILSFSHRVVSDRLKRAEVGLKNEIAEKLSKSCQGMFLWVKLCGAALDPGRNATQLRRDMSEPPNGLGEAFDRDLEKITTLKERKRKRAIEILRWTLFATRPLSVVELSEAILIDTEKETFDRSEFPDCVDEDYINFQILRICGSLIEFRPNESVDSSLRYACGTIHLAHFSIKEFLRSENRFGIQFDEHENHGRLATSCLYYLKSQHVEDFYLSNYPQVLKSSSAYAVFKKKSSFPKIRCPGVVQAHPYLRKSEWTTSTSVEGSSKQRERNSVLVLAILLLRRNTKRSVAMFQEHPPNDHKIWINNGSKIFRGGKKDRYRSRVSHRIKRSMGSSWQWNRRHGLPLL